jgi:pimeloyl-ACP methyl ester carboxylesterase
MTNLRPVFVSATICAFLVGASFPAAAKKAAASDKIVSRTATPGGVKMNYLVAGNGPVVILLHGYAETSRMWRPLIPRLASKFTVIAPDLPGIGDSDIPPSGLDMKSAATRVHRLVQALGIEKARVVGHDIGLMVAYAYAAQFPNEVEKLVLMDAFLPGVQGWEAIYNDPHLWHFRFNGPTPEALVKGRERIYFESLWSGFAADKKHSIPEADRKAYTKAYARSGRMRAAWQYFVVFPQTATEFAELAKNKLTFPILSIGGDKANGAALADQAKLIGNDVSTVIIKNCGHWVMEEKPQETMDALIKFL